MKKTSLGLIINHALKRLAGFFGQNGLTIFLTHITNMNHLIFPASMKKYDIQWALDELGYDDTFSYSLIFTYYEI